VKVTKQARREAKKLFALCKVNGVLDEARARQVVAEVTARQPRGYLGILQHFQRLLRLEIQRRTARVESAIPLAAPLREGVQAGLTRRHGPGLRFEFVENPALLGGLRVQVGSEVLDGSLRSRLAELEERLNA
jgi:F-type H+-transporting ATPase subunit delta